MSADAALHISGLTKSFHGKRAVDNVDLVVERGEIMGFLGPNGAGKTTVMNIVAGLVRADGGSVRLLGFPGGARQRDVRLRLGYLQEKPRIYPEMSARAYLEFFAGLYGVQAPAKQAAMVLERVGLTAAAERALGTYSRGMQQRACLARVMLHMPEFLMLDEPTLGLDPPAVADMREIFREMRAAGSTLFFSSHQLAEVERICDRVAFINEGRLIAAGRQADLVPPDMSPSTYQIELHEPVAPAIDAIRSLAAVATVRATGRNNAEAVLKARPDTETRDVRAALVRDLTRLGLTVLAVHNARPSLEELFLALAERSHAAPAATH